MAETRAVNGAFCKAHGIALCSFEEFPRLSLSPEEIPVLRHTRESRPQIQKGFLYAARTDPARFWELIGAFSELGLKKSSEKSNLRCIT